MASEKKMNPTNVEIPLDLITKKGVVVKIDDVDISVDGPQDVDAKLKEVSNGKSKYAAYFTTTTLGSYTVSLKEKSNGEHLKFSPVTVDVVVKEKDSNAPSAPVMPNLEKQHVEFEVPALDESGVELPSDADLMVELEGPDKDVEPVVTRDGDKISVSFDTLINDGTFSVGIKYKNEHIQRSPFVINIVPDKDTNENRVHDLEKRIKGVLTFDPLPPHKEIQFTVPGRLRNLQYTKASECVGFVISGEDEKVPVIITDDDKKENTFRVSFHALKEGEHVISITHHEEEIVNSPFRVVIPPEAFGKKK